MNLYTIVDRPDKKRSKKPKNSGGSKYENIKKSFKMIFKIPIWEKKAIKFVGQNHNMNIYI